MNFGCSFCYPCVVTYKQWPELDFFKFFFYIKICFELIPKITLTNFVQKIFISASGLKQTSKFNLERLGDQRNCDEQFTPTLPV